MNEIIMKEFELKKFLLYTYPITLQMLLRNLIGMSDNFMVGLLGPTYMAGLRIATGYFFFFIILLFAFTNAGTILLSQYWGRKDYNNYYKLASANIIISIFISTILSLVTFYGSYFLAEIMIKDHLTIKYASTYLKIISFSFIPMGINIVLSSLFTIKGDTKTPYYQQIISTIVNIILNYLLIFGKFGFPKMEVKGAALASVISTFVGLFFIIFSTYKNKIFVFIESKLSEIINNIISILKVGLPYLGDMFFWQFASMVYLKFIGLSGPEAVAIYGVIGLFFSVLFLFVSGFVSGTGIIVGQLIGANLIDNAIQFTKKSLFFSIIISFFASVLLLINVFWIPDLFKLKGEAYLQALICLVILAIRQPFSTTCGVLPSAIRAGKDTLSPLFVSLLGFLFFGLPFSFIFQIVLKMGIIGMFIAISLDEISKAFMFYFRFKSKKWIKINVKQNDNNNNDNKAEIYLIENEEFIKN